MRTIQRRAAPVCLSQQPGQQDWGAFIGTPCQAQVDTELRLEQQGLCCYCESTAAPGDSHIEHMEPRKANAGRTYDYANLAISCNGGKGEHCGHYKDDRHRNPTGAWNAQQFSAPHVPQTGTLFRYLSNGSIAATAVASDKAEYLIAYLGLNCARLTERRRQHAELVVDTLGECGEPDIISWLFQEYLQPDAAGYLKPYHSLSKALLQP